MTDGVQGSSTGLGEPPGRQGIEVWEAQSERLERWGAIAAGQTHPMSNAAQSRRVGDAHYSFQAILTPFLPAWWLLESAKIP